MFNVVYFALKVVDFELMVRVQGHRKAFQYIMVVGGKYFLKCYLMYYTALKAMKLICLTHTYAQKYVSYAYMV